MTRLQEKQRTETETAIIDNFAVLEGKARPDSVKLKSARDAAMTALRQNGLPSRRMESWHYTDLRTLVAHIAPYNDAAGGALAAPLIADNAVLGVVNGKAVSEGADALADICVIPLGALPAENDIHWKSDFSSDNIISQINTAFVSDGWKIDIPADASPGRILELQNIQNGAQSHVRFPVSVGKNAAVTVIERQIGDGEEAFLSSVSDLDIAEGAQVAWIIIRERGLSSTELNQFNARLEKNTDLRLYIIQAGAQLVRQEVNVDLAGRGADFQLRGINLLSGKTHTDTTMTVRHLVEATTSTEIIRNVVTDDARGVFQGMIRVAQAAQKTDARMACNSLILSDSAEFDAKPELEIFADDVACGHGATVAEIDHDHLFYLMARGIPEAQARSLLIKAFVGELIEEFNRPEIEEALQSVLDKWLKTHI